MKSNALPALEGRLTCTVEEAAVVLGIGRGAAYRAVRRNEIPHLTLGRRVLVKVPALLELLGASPDQNSEAGPASPAVAHDHSLSTEGAPHSHGDSTPSPPSTNVLRAIR